MYLHSKEKKLGLDQTEQQCRYEYILVQVRRSVKLSQKIKKVTPTCSQ